jgi:hypothetical protein
VDNRTDPTEDFQSTPEHPANAAPLSGTQQPPNVSQLTAGPHNDPPQSPGAADTYQPPQQAIPGSSQISVWQSLRQSVDRYPLQFALSLVGVGVAVALLARRRAR